MYCGSIANVFPRLPPRARHVPPKRRVGVERGTWGKEPWPWGGSGAHSPYFWTLEAPDLPPITNPVPLSGYSSSDKQTYAILRNQPWIPFLGCCFGGEEDSRNPHRANSHPSVQQNTAEHKQNRTGSMSVSKQRSSAASVPALFSVLRTLFFPVWPAIWRLSVCLSVCLHVSATTHEMRLWHSTQTASCMRTSSHSDWLACNRMAP